MLGIVEIKANSGTFISAGAERSLALYNFSLLSRQGSHLSLLETRKALEVEIARLAARRATPADLDLLKQAVEEFEAAIETGSTRQDLTSPFIAPWPRRPKT